jgi:hypothetical protein
MLKRPETIVVWRYWFDHSLCPGILAGKQLNSLHWCGGCHYGAEGAISTKQYTCLHSTVNKASCLFVWAESARQTLNRYQACSV